MSRLTVADCSRMYQQKFLSAGIIAILVILIIIVLWSKLRG
jgi:vesicle transport through interaction with t-SNAREs protein 1